MVQGFEKKEQKVKARAATNLAFLYSLEGDSSSAERYADLAVATDKYSAQALVNKVSFCLLLCLSQIRWSTSDHLSRLSHIHLITPSLYDLR